MGAARAAEIGYAGLRLPRVPGEHALGPRESVSAILDAFRREP